MSYVETMVDQQPGTTEIKPSHVRTMLSFGDFNKELEAGVNEAERNDSDITLLLFGLGKESDPPIKLGMLLTQCLEAVGPLETTSVVGPTGKNQFAVILRGVSVFSAIPVAVDLSERTSSALGRDLPISLAFFSIHDDPKKIYDRATKGLTVADYMNKIAITDSTKIKLSEEDLPSETLNKVTLVRM